MGQITDSHLRLSYACLPWFMFALSALIYKIVIATALQIRMVTGDKTLPMCLTDVIFLKECLVKMVAKLCLCLYCPVVA